MVGEIKNTPSWQMALGCPKPKIPRAEDARNDDYADKLWQAMDESLVEIHKKGISEIFIKSRKRELCDIRHRVLYLYRYMSEESLMSMERRFGVHHSSILHSIACVENLRKFDAVFESEYENLYMMVYSKLEKL